jgi:hypothetical protein
MRGHLVWWQNEASLDLRQIQEVIVFPTYNHCQSRREHIYQGRNVPIETI